MRRSCLGCEAAVFLPALPCSPGSTSKWNPSAANRYPKAIALPIQSLAKLRFEAQGVFGSLFDRFPFPLGDRRHDVQYQSPGRGAGIEGLRY